MTQAIARIVSGQHRRAYERLGRIMQEILNRKGATNGIDDPEYQQAWQERETIKNYYGGHVPPQTEKGVK